MIFNNNLSEVTINKIDSFEIEELPEKADNEKAIIFCNIITTSLNINDGEVVRINLKPCFISDGKITRVRKTISFYQFPSCDLSENSKKFIDFSLEEKTNSKINWELVKNLFSQADIIVSHNSSFTRPWIDKNIGDNDLVWGCTVEHVDWASLGFPSRNLESLAVFSGFFYDFKNSKSSLEAVLNCLHINNSLSELLFKTVSPDIQVFAANAPRDLNHLLKEKRYRWNPEFACWWKSANNKEEADLEATWIANNLPGSEPQVFEVDAKFRFTK